MFNKIIIKGFIESGYALFVTYAISKWTFYYAYAERGYEAVGGEYILIPVIYLTAYKAIQYLFNIFREERKNAAKKRSGSAIRMPNSR
ncbi:MAG: hypothetical protein NC548_42715 [Lachnospiraceae bacterium]|nr:hypothetical protein [Lachnospiraceae bacterium]